MNGPGLTCHDFHSYAELLGDVDLAKRLVVAYQEIFGDSEVWAETYTDAEVWRKLKAELAGRASLRVCVDARTGAVVAFFWAQLCSAESIVRALGTIKYSQSLATPALVPTLEDAIGEREVIYVHDLGIRKAWRGRIWLTHLIGPVLWEVCARSGNGRVLFWSVPGTQVAAFARRAGFEEVLVTNGMHFHLGEFLVGRPCDGVNLPWRRERKSDNAHVVTTTPPESREWHR
jgi:hypothetical protein